MKTLIPLSILWIACVSADAADKSDLEMPQIVSEAEHQVNVLMQYSKSTGQCFPDPDAKVRFINGRVNLEDFKLYKNREPRLSEGLVAFEQNGKWGACDSEGRVILAAQFESSLEFQEGLAGVIKEKKYGFIDRSGKWTIEPKFDSVYRWDFVGDVCAVGVDGKCAVIDKRGKYVWKPDLKRAENLGGGIKIVTKDGEEGFLDDTGKLIAGGEPNRRYYKGK